MIARIKSWYWAFRYRLRLKRRVKQYHKNRPGTLLSVVIADRMIQDIYMPEIHKQLEAETRLLTLFDTKEADEKTTLSIIHKLVRDETP